MFKYAMTADVAKMYRQVLIDSSQTPLQCILWRDSVDQPIQTFELLTVTYGTAPAAFLAIRSLRKLAEDSSDRYSIGSRTILNDFYVDDLVTGADTLQDASTIKDETSQLLLEGGFELRRWSSNSSTLRDNQAVNLEKEFVLSSDKECETRTLDLIWNCTHDYFKFSSIACLPPLTTPTKRSILSRIALVFDPLGLLSPATVTAKIIIHEHERHFHAGPQATLFAVRQNYWLIGARNVVRQITRKCTIWFLSSPRTASTLMGNLPEARITTPERPFEKCGVDYAGPLYYKERSRKTTKLLKCYIAIFICFASTAVHIELATDLITQAFLNVLKRFISRRGCPATIHSDNVLNFRGAERELAELAALFKEQQGRQQIFDYVSTKGIKWFFIPPRAPHHSGL